MKIPKTWWIMIIALVLLGVGLAIARLFAVFMTAEAINIFLVAALVLVTAVYARETMRMSKSSEKSSDAMEQQAISALEQAEATKQMLEEMRQERRRAFEYRIDRDFYENHQFKRFRAAIDEGVALLQEDGGQFRVEDIDDYLNFFETLAHHESKGDVSIEWMEEQIGYYILSAYRNPYVINYVKHVQQVLKSERYFEGFLDLAKKVEAVETRLKTPLKPDTR